MAMVRRQVKQGFCFLDDLLNPIVTFFLTFFLTRMMGYPIQSLSLLTVSGEKAGKQIAMYSAPSAAGVL